ncbi:MAG: hypothetical protein ACRCXB_35120 [Aeromonadaceae bacterium]
MPLNPNIALSVKGIELQDPLEMYGRATAIRGAQQQNQLAQLQMQQVLREQESTNALNRAYAESYNPQTGETDINKLRGLLTSSGFGSKLPAIEKSMLELGEANTRQKKAQTELLDSKLKQSRQFLDTIDPSSPNAAEAYIQWHRANHADPVIGKALEARGITADQSMQRIQQLMQTPGGLTRLINESKLGAEKFMEMNKPQLSTTDLGGRVDTRTFAPLTGELKTIGTQTKTMAPGEAERIKNEGLRIGLEGRRVAMLEEANRSGTRAKDAAVTKDSIAAANVLPKVISRAEESLRLIDELVGKRDPKTGKLLQGEKPHPGFYGSVGATVLPGARFIPGTDAAGFMSRFDQIKNMAFLDAFESLKGAGAITEKEGKKATDAINRMSISTDEKEFIRATQDMQDVIRAGVKIARDRAARASGSTNDTTPPSRGVIDFGSLN